MKVEQTLDSIVTLLHQRGEASTSHSLYVDGSSFQNPGTHQSSPVLKQHPYVKVEFPKFSNEDAMQWLYKAEFYFRVYFILEEQKVSLASLQFDGKELAWFQLMERSNQIQDWLSLATASQVQFGPSQFDNPRSELLKIIQTVDVYYETFIELANKSYGMDDNLLMDCFVGGLIPQLRKEVIARVPQTLSQIVALAKFFEEKSTPPFYSPRQHYTSLPPKPPNQPHSTTFHNQGKLLTAAPQGPNNSPPILTTPPKPVHLKKLTPVDIQFRREKGLCFTCDEKFSPGHKCANKHYFLFQTTKEIAETTNEEAQQQAEEEPSPVESIDHHLSYHALKGISARGTIRFTGSINGIDIQILLDGGSSNNFLQPRLAKFLKL